MRPSEKINMKNYAFFLNAKLIKVNEKSKVVSHCFLKNVKNVNDIFVFHEEK